MNHFGIGSLARRAGVSIDTVRYYEKAGLLTAPVRLPSGYRRYSDAEVNRLRFVRGAQSLGFSLKEAAELLGLSGEKNVSKVKRRAQEKLADIEMRLESLQAIRDGLKQLVDACPGRGNPGDCPILNALGKGHR